MAESRIADFKLGAPHQGNIDVEGAIVRSLAHVHIIENSDLVVSMPRLDFIVLVIPTPARPKLSYNPDFLGSHGSRL